MFKKVLISFVVAVVVLSMASLSWGQNLTAKQKKDVDQIIRLLPSFVDELNKGITNDIDILSVLKEVLAERKRSNEEVVSQWIMLTWLESYYRDLSLLYPDRRKNYESGMLMCQLKVGVEFERFKKGNVSGIMKEIQQETKTAYLKSPSRVTK